MMIHPPFFDGVGRSTVFDCPSSVFGISFDHRYDLEREHFSADIRMVSVPDSDVSG